MSASTTFSAPFLLSSIPSYKNILKNRIYFRVKTTEIYNQYDLYSRTCVDGSSMIEGVDFTISYKPVAGIWTLCIIISIASAEGLIIFVLDISNAFQNTILPNPSEIVYLSLPYIYLDWYKIKRPKHPLALINQMELCIQSIKLIQGTQPAGKFWYDLLKLIFITVKMIRSSYDHDLFSWVYKTHKSFLAVETYYILM